MNLLQFPASRGSLKIKELTKRAELGERANLHRMLDKILDDPHAVVRSDVEKIVRMIDRAATKSWFLDFKGSLS